MPEYQNLRVPSNALLALRLSPGKGWGAFATQNIRKGAVILKEKATLILPPLETDGKASTKQLVFNYLILPTHQQQQ